MNIGCERRSQGRKTEDRKVGLVGEAASVTIAEKTGRKRT